MSSVVMKKGSEVEMPNREQVVKSIECHLNQSVNCNDCSYDDGGGCLDTLLKDVITLLKEEEKGMMTDEIYYDTFENSYAFERDENAPPERYKRICRGAEGLYQECWEISSYISGENDLFMSIVFSEEDYNDKDRHDTTVKHMCDINHCKPIRLKYTAIPAHKFDEIVKQLEEEKRRKCMANFTASPSDLRDFPMAVDDKHESSVMKNALGGHCPNCHQIATFITTDPNYLGLNSYCKYCGQALYWGENPLRYAEKGPYFDGDSE